MTNPLTNPLTRSPPAAQNYNQEVNNTQFKKDQLATRKAEQVGVANSSHHRPTGREAHKQLVLMKKSANLNAASINNDHRVWRSHRTVGAVQHQNPSDTTKEYIKEFNEALNGAAIMALAHERIGDEFAEVANHPLANINDARASAVHQYSKAVNLMVDVANNEVKCFDALFQEFHVGNEEEKRTVQKIAQGLSSSFDDLQEIIKRFGTDEIYEKFPLFPKQVESIMKYFAAIPLLVSLGPTGLLLRRNKLVMALKFVADNVNTLFKALSMSGPRPGSSVSLGLQWEPKLTAIDEVEDSFKTKPQPLVKNKQSARGVPMEVIDAARYLSFEEFEDRFKKEAQILVQSRSPGGVAHGNH